MFVDGWQPNNVFDTTWAPTATSTLVEGWQIQAPLAFGEVRNVLEPPRPPYPSPTIIEVPDDTTQALVPRKRFRLLVTYLMPNRKRRVINPVKGNNDAGQKGKIRCKQCRRIHIKV
jgi:hypothetical protein